eukprot:6455653-Amphidinium_carterae.1
MKIIHTTPDLMRQLTKLLLLWQHALVSCMLFAIEVGQVSGGQTETPVPGVYVTNFSEANPVSLYPADGLAKVLALAVLLTPLTRIDAFCGTQKNTIRSSNTRLAGKIGTSYGICWLCTCSSPAGIVLVSSGQRGYVERHGLRCPSG